MKTLNLVVVVAIISLVIAQSAMAGNDPSIQGDLRENIQAAMGQHIDSNKMQGNYVIYDAVKGKMKKLQLKELHSGIVKKGDFYVSCADFVDNKGEKYDLDFLVADTGSGYKVLQSIVHSIDGEKRKYHIEG